MNSVTAIASAIPLRQRAKRGSRPTKAAPDLGTWQTAVKLYPDFISKLREELHQAAIAIDRAYCIVCAKAMARASNFEPRTSPSKEAQLDPKSKKAKLLNAYWEWQQEMTKRNLKISPIIDMVVEGTPPFEVDRLRGWLPGLAMGRLLEALELYCRCAR